MASARRSVQASRRKRIVLSTLHAGIQVTRSRSGGGTDGCGNGNRGHANASTGSCGAEISVGNLTVESWFVDSADRIEREGVVAICRSRLRELRSRESVSMKMQAKLVNDFSAMYGNRGHVRRCGWMQPRVGTAVTRSPGFGCAANDLRGTAGNAGHACDPARRTIVQSSGI